MVIIKEVDTVTLKNFTLTNGYSESHGCTGGGGLLLTADDMFSINSEDGANIHSSSPLIENVILENNHSKNGGGLAFNRVIGPVVRDVIIRNNTSSKHGGGVFCFVSTITMENVTVTGNESGDEQGGGIMLAASQGTLDSMTITNNISNHHGGGIWTNSSGGPDGSCLLYTSPSPRD